MASGSRNDKSDADVKPTGETQRSHPFDRLSKPDSRPDGNDGRPTLSRTGLIADRLRHEVNYDLWMRLEALREGKSRPRAYLDQFGDSPQDAVRRPIPVTIYLSDDEAESDASQAVEDVLTAFDFEVVDNDIPPLRGSWYKSLVARVKKALTSAELAERLQKMERSIELQLLHKQQAEIDALQGDAVAKLIAALDKSRNALIQVGSVLLIKIDGQLTVRNLTHRELIHLERNPCLLRDPVAILVALQGASASPPEVVREQGVLETLDPLRKP